MVHFAHKERKVVSFLGDIFVGTDESYAVSPLKHWHCRMGHINCKNLILLNQQVEGMKISDFKLKNCENCELYNANEKPVPTPGQPRQWISFTLVF